MTPLGRDTKVLKADFLTSDVPAWLTVPIGSTVGDNALETSGTEDIETILFTVSKLEHCAITVNNLRLHSGSATMSMKLVSEDGTKVIGLFGEDKNTYFRYILDGEQISQDTCALQQGGSYAKSALVAAQDVAYQTRSKTLKLSIQPRIGHLILEFNNTSMLYTKWNLNDLNIDWSGKWKFVITSNGIKKCSSVELEFQQNI